jgi:sterol desaturase/sphingolipid hydroxylase (fatty acid hydroxylase superfamily)
MERMDLPVELGISAAAATWPFAPGSEPLIRLGLFALVLALLAGLEVLAPRREQSITRSRRWPANLGLVVVDTLAVRIIFPTALVGWALFVEARGWGLFNMLSLPAAAEVGIAFVLLDLVIYGQHVLFHGVPLLWRLHRVHHSDLEFDVTTGVRFHPVEIVLSMLIKFAAVAVLGAPALAVILFEIVLNAASLFNHSNIALPPAAEWLLRLVLVTPDMHRVHHSQIARETHSNFGFNLAWWDRLFATYRAQPEKGHCAMVIGLPDFRDPGELRLGRMLLQPLRAGKVTTSVPGKA